MAKGKNILTTGDVAKICSVAPRTVSKWFDSGQLKGYRIPGSKDRRIPVNELVRFMKLNNMPVTMFPVDKIRVLIADSDLKVCEKLAKDLMEKADYDVKTVSDNFEIGISAHKFSPHVLLISLFAKDISAVDICRKVRDDDDLQTIKVIAIANKLSDIEAAALIQQGFDGYISGSDGIDEIIKKVEEAVAIIY
ncbi:MAG TPA: helix-turn-helix domain-containing protein [Sedimentisphaerales bacterium]|nr:helix-turn-helix domain-containing protein [Sedimentisphaerales bacterium]